MHARTNLLRPLLGDVRNQPIKRLMAGAIYIYLNMRIHVQMLHFYLSTMISSFDIFYSICFGGSTRIWGPRETQDCTVSIDIWTKNTWNQQLGLLLGSFNGTNGMSITIIYLHAWSAKKCRTRLPLLARAKHQHPLPLVACGRYSQTQSYQGTQ